MATFSEENEPIDLTDATPIQRPDGRTWYRIGDMLYLKDEKDFGIRAFTGRKWPNATVIWKLADSGQMEAYYRQQLQVAFDMWTQGSGVRFKERTNETGYIEIIPSDANLSAVGYYDMAVPLDFASWGSPGVLAHELGHALGAQHEHQRSDRNNFVTVDEGNVIPAYRGNFTRIASTKNVSAYDFLSVMHYGMYVPSFSLDPSKPVVSPKPGFEQFDHQIGHLRYLSEQDKADMAAYYGLA